MKKCIILFGICCKLIVASEREVLMPMVVDYGSSSNSRLGWVEEFKNDPQSYRRSNPARRHELFSQLKAKDSLLSERDFLVGVEQILESYVGQLESFEGQHCCATMISSIGSGLTTLLAGAQSVGTFLSIKQYVNAVRDHEPKEAREPYLWLGSTLAVTTVITIPMGYHVINHLQKKFLRKKLYERGEAHIAMYEIVKELTGNKMIDW